MTGTSPSDQSPTSSGVPSPQPAGLDPGAPARRPRPLAAATGQVRRRVLVVEDDRDSREMLRLILEFEGHEVHEAEDGPGGIEVAITRRPDVTVVDVGLPGMDGFEVARRIRSAPSGRDLLLVALTGHAQPEDRLRSQEAGFDIHLTKPMTREKVDELLRLVGGPTRPQGSPAVGC